MKIVRLIITVLLVLGSALTIGLTVMRGMEAPEDSKIIGVTTDIQSVETTGDGIQMLGDLIANQIGEDMLDKDGIELEEAKLKETQEVHIPAYEAKVAAKEDAYNAAQTEIAELGELKSLNNKQKQQLKDAEAVVADYKATVDTLNIYKNNIGIMEDNIAASKKAVENAKVDGENAIALANSISVTMMWCYALVGLIILIAIISLFADLFISFAQNWKKTLLKLVLFVVIIGGVGAIAGFVASGHGWFDGNYLLDAAGYPLGLGTDPATREVFGATDYMISDVSLIICYIVAGAAIASAVFSVIIGFFKK